MFQIVLWSGCTVQVVSTLHKVTLVKTVSWQELWLSFASGPLLAGVLLRFTVDWDCTSLSVQVNDCKGAMTSGTPAIVLPAEKIISRSTSAMHCL